MRNFKVAYNFTAVLSLFPTENGGRKKPVYDHYRPAFSFSSPNQLTGEITFIGQTELQPGSTANIMVKLIPSRLVSLQLKGGDPFKIMEGNKIVGTGVIQEIKDEHRIMNTPVN